MSEEHAQRYVIFGAGAIGGALAVLLKRSGLRVICVARPAQAEALRRGVSFTRGGEAFTEQVEAVTAARDLRPAGGDVIILTVKSQATASAIDDLAGVYADTTPIVCLQNGATNEEEIGRAHV